MKYTVIAPQGEITIGLSYGSVTFKHGQIVDEDETFKLFPEHFFPIREDLVEKQKAIFEKINSNKNNVKEEVPKPIKKKPGRPRKNIITKG